jgi:hypothetical protein
MGMLLRRHWESGAAGEPKRKPPEAPLEKREVKPDDTGRRKRNSKA